MSDEGRNYVKQYSPFTGSTFWVHYVLGDLANWQHGYEVFVGNRRLTEEWPFSLRAVERAMTDLIDGGYLVVVTPPAPGRSVRYRFEFKGAEHLARQSGGRTDPDTRQSGANGRQSGGRTSANLALTPAKSEIAPITNRIINRNVNRNGTQLAEDLASSSPAQASTDAEKSTNGNTQTPTTMAPTAAKTRPQDLLFDAVAEVCGIIPAELTSSARGALNNALKALRAVKATPNEIRARAAEYRKRWPNATLTPSSLAKHWPELRPSAQQGEDDDQFAGIREYLIGADGETPPPGLDIFQTVRWHLQQGATPKTTDSLPPGPNPASEGPTAPPEPWTIDGVLAADRAHHLEDCDYHGDGYDDAEYDQGDE